MIGDLRVVGYGKGPGLLTWRVGGVSQIEEALAAGRQCHPDLAGAERRIDTERLSHHHILDQYRYVLLVISRIGKLHLERLAGAAYLRRWKVQGLRRDLQR